MANTWQTILDAARTNLGQTQADVERENKQNKENFDKLMAYSKEDKVKGIRGSRENASSRGLLDSSIALNQEADVNSAYARQDDSYLTNYSGTISQLASKLLGAQNSYTNAQTGYDAEELKNQVTVNTPAPNAPTFAADGTPTNSTDGSEFDPSDPYGWKKIDATIKANTPITNNGVPTSYDDGSEFDPSDPYGWKRIAASKAGTPVVPAVRKPVVPVKAAPRVVQVPTGKYVVKAV